MILHFNNNPLRLRTSAEKPEKIETISFIALLISWKLGQVAPSKKTQVQTKAVPNPFFQVNDNF